MREIKFRAWNPKMKRMSDSSELQYRGFQYSEKRNSFAVLNMFSGQDDDEILMQYTGLKDKSGCEVFEGDIVKVDRLDSFSNFDMAFVVYAESRVRFLLQIKHPKSPIWESCIVSEWDIEVIGNIYENPELLEV